jgi:phosphatidylglycerol:prolipoprotein diacylglycerol transferase
VHVNIGINHMNTYWHQPEIDPVLLHIWGPLQIRWYSLLYVGGFVVGRYLLRRLAREDRFLFTEEDVEQLILWLLIGVVIGARVVYCFVYDPRALIADPLFLFKVYEGGLSFHGGMLGAMAAAWLYTRKIKIPFWNLGDALALATPPGLAMGRLGNFLNGELWGRVSYVPWAVVFKHGGPNPRHPSQLYELLLEGIILFSALWLLKSRLKRNGEISLAFIMGYSLCRFTAEFFREPDVQVGYLFLGLSMGQILSLLMFLGGGVLALYLWKKGTPAPAKSKTRPRK